MGDKIDGPDGGLTPFREDTPEGGPFDPPRVTADDIRFVQRLLNGVGANLPVDGVAGPQTITAARTRGPRAAENHPEARERIERVAALAGSSGPTGPGRSVWILYAGVRASRPEWFEKVQEGSTLFWTHGTHVRGGAYHRQLQRWDSALLIVGQQIIASGMLIADSTLRFVDGKGRVRRPFRIVRTYSPPISRAAIEGTSKLIKQGSVHPMPTWAVASFNDIASSLDLPQLPYSRETGSRLLTKRSLLDDVESEAPWILPDDATAKALGWTGPVWTGASSPLTSGTDLDAQIPFVLDAPAESEDQLDRGPFALFLAQRLHLIWCQLNGQAPDGRGGRTTASPPDSDTFIVHVDSPWGGGKTTFANFVARVLDPRGQTLSPQHFLRSSLAPTAPDEELAGVPLDEIFVPPFAKKEPDRWPDARRSWIVARYNAWRDQYVQPPWWQVFLSIHGSISRELRRDSLAALRDLKLGAAATGLWRWGRSLIERFAYQVWNRKLQGQVLLWLIVGMLYLALWQFSVFERVLAASIGQQGTLDPKKAGEWIGLAIAVLGLGGASIATLFTIVSQSLAPDLDFTAEHKQIGVKDPISRFRRTFDRILRATPRPVLLIVDDLDRCEPKTVVELLRGFQTIMRSPRLFVLLLGDRAWIENAHDVYHKDLSGLREGEGSLGARFVQKVIQLSFRLPIMKAEARSRFARKVLGGADGDQAAAEVAEVLRQVDAKVSEIVEDRGAVGNTEARAAKVLKAARAALPKELSKAEKEVAVELADKLVSVKIVATAGADTAQQRSVFNAVTQLVDSLPNNPRQIKRIFMAFATYEIVGRSYFGYQLTAEGPDGERRARRWRQLAMWVTLAIEWPETWRRLARQPGILGIAYLPPKNGKEEESKFLSGFAEAERAEVAATLDKLRSDKALRALLCPTGPKRPAGAASDFAETAMEIDAIYEFNRIIWEPGFKIDPRD